jgi:hypothetical protein
MTCSFRVLTILLPILVGVSYETATSQAGEVKKVLSGSLAENVYTSGYFGFSYTFPSGWIVVSGPKELDCKGGCPLLDVRAPDYPNGGRIQVMVDEVGRMPAGTSGRDYLGVLHSSTVNTGGTALTDVIETTRQGRTFYRRDYREEGLLGHGWHKSLVVVTLRKSAVWFLITAASQEKLKTLLLTVDSVRFASIDTH